MGGGELGSYLQRNKHHAELITPALLLSAISQVAAAMSLLEKYRIVHRDLAVR
jgi:hypothetical protein